MQGPFEQGTLKMISTIASPLYKKILPSSLNAGAVSPARLQPFGNMTQTCSLLVPTMSFPASESVTKSALSSVKGRRRRRHFFVIII